MELGLLVTVLSRALAATDATKKQNGVAQYSYTDNKGVIAGQVRSANDPYVVASYLTSGTYNFGLTTKEKAEIGMGLIVVGLAISLAVCGCIVWAVRCVDHHGDYHHI